MAEPMSAEAVLDREYLEIRAKILELAASFDRLDRGADAGAAVTVDSDSRMALIHEGLDALKQTEPGRAERVQMIFSRQYKPNWRGDMGL